MFCVSEKISSVLLKQKRGKVKDELDKPLMAVIPVKYAPSPTVSSLDKEDDEPIMKLWARRFQTGTLETVSSSLVCVYNNRIQYILRNHPDGGSVSMIMFFAHIRNPRICGTVLSFQIDKTMCHFPSYYDPGNTKHLLALNFYANEIDKLPDVLRLILGGKLGISNLP